MQAQSSLGIVTHAVMDAAKAAVETTTDYVVEPIGKALGLIAPEGQAELAQPKAARKAIRKAIVARAEAARAADKAARRRK